jgi:hypothetical protein
VQSRCRSGALCKFAHDTENAGLKSAQPSPSTETEKEKTIETLDQRIWGAVVYNHVTKIITVQDYRNWHYDHVSSLPLGFGFLDPIQRKARQTSLYWIVHDDHHSNVTSVARVALFKYELSFHEKPIAVQRLFLDDSGDLSLGMFQINGSLWPVLIEAVKQCDMTFFYILRDKVIGFDQLIGYDAKDYPKSVTAGCGGFVPYGKERTEFLDLLMCHESRWHMIYAMLHDKCFALERTKYAAVFVMLAEKFAKQLISAVGKHCTSIDVARLVESY